MSKIRDFKIEKTFSSTNGTCHIATSLRDGKKYFIKKNTDVTYGSDSDPEELKAKYDKTADEWFKKKNLLCQELAKLDSCTREKILFAHDIFLEGRRIYEAHPILTLYDTDVCSLCELEKVMVMRILVNIIAKTYSLGIGFLNLNKQGIIVQKSELGGHYPIIDGSNECSFLSGLIDKNCFHDDYYISPEIARRLYVEELPINNFGISNCIFSLGLIFYEWWTGSPLLFEGMESGPLEPYNVIHKIWPDKITANSEIPNVIWNLILSMLCPCSNMRATLDEIQIVLKNYCEAIR